MNSSVKGIITPGEFTSRQWVIAAANFPNYYSNRAREQIQWDLLLYYSGNRITQLEIRDEASDIFYGIDASMQINGKAFHIDFTLDPEKLKEKLKKLKQTPPYDGTRDKIPKIIIYTQWVSSEGYEDCIRKSIPKNEYYSLLSNNFLNLDIKIYFEQHHLTAWERSELVSLQRELRRNIVTEKIAYIINKTPE